MLRVLGCCFCGVFSLVAIAIEYFRLCISLVSARAEDSRLGNADGNMYGRCVVVFLIIFMLNLLLLFFSSTAAYATSRSSAAAQLPPVSTPTCMIGTSFQSTKSQLLDDILTMINDILQKAVSGVYGYIANDAEFLYAVNAMVALYIAVYGAMLMFQMVSAKPGEVVVRLLKIGLIYAMVSPTGWLFFSQYVRLFFLGGMNEIITRFNDIALGTRTFIADPYDMAGITKIIATPVNIFFSERMIKTLIAILLTGPYGIVFSLMTIWGMGLFLYAVMAAMGTYIKALVGLYLLFALAPLFFTFLLFESTRHLFDRWLNQLVKFSLQPIFVFSLLGFFFVMIMSGMQGILKVPICYVKFVTLDLGVYKKDFLMWRFALPGRGNNSPAYVIYDGGWGSCGPEEFCENAKTGECVSCIYDMLFPVDITNIFFLILTSLLAFRYVSYTENIAKQLSGASVGVGVRPEDARGWINKNNLTPIKAGKGLAVTSVKTVVTSAKVGKKTVVTSAKIARRGWKFAEKIKNKVKNRATRGKKKNSEAKTNDKTTSFGRGKAHTRISGSKKNSKSPFKTPPGRGGGKRG